MVDKKMRPSDKAIFSEAVIRILKEKSKKSKIQRWETVVYEIPIAEKPTDGKSVSRKTRHY